MLPFTGWFHIAAAVARLQERVGWPFRHRGLGRLLRLSRRDHIFRWEGLQLYFNHNVAGCYDSFLVPGGERETHLFLHSILDAIPNGQTVQVVDVGANIGEITLDVARHDRVSSVLAFEPQVQCGRACALSAALNRLERKVSVRPVALSATSGLVRFRVNEVSPQASAVVEDSAGGISVLASTLDAETQSIAAPCLVKIDVEGGELGVLQGGRKFIDRAKPLIVFEYNHLGRNRFGLHDIMTALGAGYEIFRLTGAGKLNRALEQSWNCVAMHGESAWADGCRSLIT